MEPKLTASLMRLRDSPDVICPDEQPRIQKTRGPRCCPDTAVYLPYENYRGAVLNEKYRITSMWATKEHLGVYAVTGWNDERFEAQAFDLCRLPDKLYLSRKRRLRRLKQSGNCTDDFKQNQSRYLISPAPPSRSTWRQVHSDSRADQKPEDHSELHFPSLKPSSGCDRSRPTDSQSCNARPKTYAEAASRSPATAEPSHAESRNACVDAPSISRKGARQRERRQKRREQRRLKAAHLNGEEQQDGV